MSWADAYPEVGEAYAAYMAALEAKEAVEVESDRLRREYVTIRHAALDKARASDPESRDETVHNDRTGQAPAEETGGRTGS